MIFYNIFMICLEILTYAQFAKGTEVSLEDKIINPTDWVSISRVFSGAFLGILRQDFKGIYLSFFYDPYFDNFSFKLISICLAKTNVAQTQFKNQAATQKAKVN